MSNPPRFENTHAVACLRTHWAPASADLHRAVAELVTRRGDLGVPALGVVVVDEAGCRARVAMGAWAALTVGRHCSTDVSLGRADASLRHLAFVRDGGEVAAFDLASTHGCSSNDARAAAGVPLVVRVGDSIVVACCVDAGGSFPPLTPSLVRDAEPLRLRVVDPERSLSSTPRTARNDGWRSPLARGQLPLAGLEQPLLIGRLPRNDLVVDCDLVSRVHAAVLPLRQGTVLIDVGSTNGTTVTHRGRSLDLGVVQRCAPLVVGDVVEIGGVRLQAMGSASRVVYSERAWRGGEQ